jgi:oligopeptide/dipeptide ABC transporter ATP-binding protein
MSRREQLAFTKEVQMIFQDPYASLNPRMKVYDIVAEGIRYHKLAASRQEEREQVRELLTAVGLNAEQSNRFPHEFSGGQRQRIGIARALAVNPEFLMCDEPISALDVSIQAQIVNLLRKIQKERNLTMIFIAHDLPMVRYISDRIAVMYLGKIVELASSEELCDHPQHPYTKVLLSAIPVPDPKEARERERIFLEGEIPNPTEKFIGCAFYNRCPYAKDKCKDIKPEMKETSAGHLVACHQV